MGERAARDQSITVWVDAGSIADAHMLGRKRDGQPINLFGCDLLVNRTWLDGYRRCFVLLVADAKHPDFPQMMCWSCGSFDVSREEVDDPYYCTRCGSRDIEGAPDGCGA